MVEAVILQTISDLIKDEYSLFKNFKKEVEKLSSKLSLINKVLEDADKKEVEHKSTEDFLEKLKDELYEVRDVMDACSFEDLRLQVNRRNASSSTRIKVTNFIKRPFIDTCTRLKIGRKIKDVQEKLHQISLERQNFHLPNYDSNIHKSTRSWRQTTSSPISTLEVVYGRDKEKKDIIDILLNNSVVKQLSVLPILGIGGLGKTTLARMVFNDDEVSKHFDTKFWVCVSDEFDITLVIKGMIIGVNHETSSEILQQMIRKELIGKRYLIVLDDVWNEKEDLWADLRSILDCGSNGAFVLTTTRTRKVAEIMKTIQPFKLSLLSDDDCWLLLEDRAFKFGTPKTINFVDIGREIARKCKGVPLLAKTLGSQLGSNSNENEWCRIRDSEIWEIFQNNESDLLPILRLSYYGLPDYNLKKCFVFCAIFPKDTKMEKEKLIQLWMAHGLIHPFNNEELEDAGNRYWNELCWKSFFQEEKKDLGNRVTCKMHDLMHDLAISVMKNGCYTIKENGCCLRPEIRHITVMVDELDNTTVCSLQNIRGLQSINLHNRKDGENVIKEILRVLKEFPSLRSFEVGRKHLIDVKGHQMECLEDLPFKGCNVKWQEDLRYVGGLIHLRYLNLSGIEVTILHDSICDLLNLQVLNLDNCSKLESLPKNTKNLISLRHLYLNGCSGLQYMPRGMGQLKYLKTLSLFVISEEIDHGQLDEMKELNIGGSLIIKNLGRVSDASIARGISMAKMSSIERLELELELEWKYNSTRHEKICDALEISTVRLKILKMRNYKGVNLPKWVGKSSSSPTRLKSGDSSVVLFPVLEELHITSMKNLRELMSPSCWSIGTGAFPNLRLLKIDYCPKVGALPVPHLKALKDVSVQGECWDELLYSISNLSALTHLELVHMEERSVLFPAPSWSTTSLADNNELGVRSTLKNDTFPLNGTEVVLFPLLEKLSISQMKNLREIILVSPTIPAFPNLCRLEISNCPKLGALPVPHLKALKEVTVWRECSDELLYSISNLSALTHLELLYMDERSVLFPAPSWSTTSLTLGDNNELGVRSSLKNDTFPLNGTEVVLFPLLEKLSIPAFPNLCRLNIGYCPKLGALPVPHLKALKEVSVWGECSDELLYSISNLSALTHLKLYRMDERSVLFPAKALMYNEISSSSSTTLTLGDNNDQLAHDQLGVRSTFQSLQSLTIYRCNKLRRLFDSGMTTFKISGGLTELYIYDCSELMISVEEFGKLDINNSLQRMRIKDCPKLVSSEEEEVGDLIAVLRSLRARLGAKNFNVEFLQSS